MAVAHSLSAEGRPDAPASSGHIVSVEGVMGGRPVIRGTRITVTSVAGRVAGKDTVEDLMADYPDVPREAFESALAQEAGRIRVEPLP